MRSGARASAMQFDDAGSRLYVATSCAWTMARWSTAIHWKCLCCSCADCAGSSTHAEGAAALASAMPQSMLSTLHLNGTFMGSVGACALAAALPHSRLTSLNVSGNQLGLADVEALVAVLPATQLVSLSLSGTCFDEATSDGAVRALAHVLPACRITSLNFSANNIGAHGARTIAESLPQTNLTTLRLQCLLPRARAAGPSPSLHLALTAPRVCKRADNAMGDEGIGALAAVLPYASLTELHVQRTCNPGARSCWTLLIAQLMPFLCVRRSAENQMSPAGAQALETVLPRSQLSVLAVNGAPVSMASVDWRSALVRAGCWCEAVHGAYPRPLRVLIRELLIVARSDTSQARVRSCGLARASQFVLFAMFRWIARLNYFEPTS